VAVSNPSLYVIVRDQGIEDDVFYDNISVANLIKLQRNLTMIGTNSNPMDPVTGKDDMAKLLRDGVTSLGPQGLMDLQTPCLCYKAGLL
jgi:hypothetical protein